MQARALLILGIALILGAATVVLMNRYLQMQVAEPEPVETIVTTPVVVAATDLGAGQHLAETEVRLVDWPDDSVPDGAFNSIRELLGEAPPVVLIDIRRGEPLMRHRLSPHGARGGLPSRIPEDMRAITIPVNEIRGVAGFPRPGDYVDVIHTTSLGRVDDRPVARVILQNARLLGIDQISSTDDTDPHIARAATLLVTPYDGQRLSLAQRTGEVGLMLRNEFDASLVEDRVASYQELLATDTQPVVITRRERRDPEVEVIRPEVEVIRGLDITQEVVKEGEPVDDDDDDDNESTD